MIRLLLAINLFIALACCHNAHAGPFAPKQSPDNWSNAALHGAGNHIIGIAVTIVAPDLHPINQWAMCQIPGAIHEFAPSRGNYRSNRDLLINSLGCGLGVWAGHGFGVAPTAGGVAFNYSVRF